MTNRQLPVGLIERGFCDDSEARGTTMWGGVPHAIAALEITGEGLQLEVWCTDPAMSGFAPRYTVGLERAGEFNEVGMFETDAAMLKCVDYLLAAFGKKEL